MNKIKKQYIIILALMMIVLLFIKKVFFFDSWRLLFNECVRHMGSGYLSTKKMALYIVALIMIIYICHVLLTDASEKVIVIILGLFCAIALFSVVFEKTSKRNDIWGGDITVAHSFGAVDGYDYTGSYEAFLQNYDKGHRTFEVDFQLTSDEVLVLTHDWEEAAYLQDGFSTDIPTSEEFLSKPILYNYTPMSIYDLVDVMIEYEDIFIVTDTKDVEDEAVKKKISAIVEAAKTKNAEPVLDRFIIQIYSPSNYEVVKKIYDFKQYIFTLYQYWHHDDIQKYIEICEWCVANDIKYITMWNYKYTDEIAEISNSFGLKVMVHTENDIDAAKEYLEMGAMGIYTDFIAPSELILY